MKTEAIQQTQTYKKPFLNPKNTGYLAGSAIIVTTLRAFTNSKPVAKSHKIFGCISVALTLLHIGTIEYLHSKYKKL